VAGHLPVGRRCRKGDFFVSHQPDGVEDRRSIPVWGAYSVFDSPHCGLGSPMVGLRCRRCDWAGHGTIPAPRRGDVGEGLSGKTGCRWYGRKRQNPWGGRRSGNWNPGRGRGDVGPKASYTSAFNPAGNTGSIVEPGAGRCLRILYRSRTPVHEGAGLMMQMLHHLGQVGPQGHAGSCCRRRSQGAHSALGGQGREFGFALPPLGPFREPG